MNLFFIAVVATLYQSGVNESVRSAHLADLPVSSQGATPRTYQSDASRADPFRRAIQLAEAMKRQPASSVARRAWMVDTIRRNITATESTLDAVEVERTLQALGQISREQFVPKVYYDLAYISTPVGIGYDQTISDPYIVAIMTAAVRPRAGDMVLDVGTGSGYQAAVLSLLARSVVSIEIVAPLARTAAKRLRHLGYRNVDVIAGDGFTGVPQRAPFDAIIVAAGAKAVPAALLEQLKPSGRLVMPIGPGQFREQLILVAKSSSGILTQCSLGPAGFVPFTGKALLKPFSSPAATDGVPLCYGVSVT